MTGAAIREWPSIDLESVDKCPVCGEGARRPLHSEMTDRVFSIADGSWDLYQCVRCRSAYLDPRPTSGSIGRAYAGYYTHSVNDHPLVRRKGIVRTLLHDLIAGYQNGRYNVRRHPSLAAGRWILPFLPSLRAAADAECRHLPVRPSNGGYLLDVGCGNGGFMVLANQAGWQVKGVDFDSGAVAAARLRGLDVQLGGIDALSEEDESFDVITLCHVIEHVYEPVDVLRRAFALLKPGGILWIDTPNIGSLGAHRFRANWHALDPPRHLMLFNRDSMEMALKAAGFESTRQRWRGLSLFEVFAASEAIARGDIGSHASYDGRPPLRSILFELWEMMYPPGREFLTITARKPS